MIASDFKAKLEPAVWGLVYECIKQDTTVECVV